MEDKVLERKLDRITTHPVFGYLVLLGIVLLIFLVIFWFGGLVSALLMHAFLLIGGYVQGVLGHGWAYHILWEGAAQGLIAAIAFVLPFLLPFYIVMEVLETTGYLARAGKLLDHLMHRFGLHGGAFIPIILGYGCSVPAVLGTRVLKTKRERFIASLLAVQLPCAAKTTVIMALVGAFMGWYWALGLYAFNIVVIMTMGLIASKILPGRSREYHADLPPFQLPSPGHVLRHSWQNLREFVLIAVPIIVIGSILLVLLDLFRIEGTVNQLFSPITVWMLGLPAAVGIVLLLGVFRKELTLAMLVTIWNAEPISEHLTAVQMLVFTVFVMFYIPCLSTLAAFFKMFGLKRTIIVALLQFVLALGIAGLLRIMLMLMT
jgi:ferrous iron transport protein B